MPLETVGREAEEFSPAGSNSGVHFLNQCLVVVDPGYANRGLTNKIHASHTL